MNGICETENVSPVVAVMRIMCVPKETLRCAGMLETMVTYIHRKFSNACYVR
jgi:hypothetical protein